MIGSNRRRGSAGTGNIARNIAWLLGGKGFGAAVSLAYLAILARALGLEGFGLFAVIFGLAQALVAIAGFQSWQIIVRFGTGPAIDGDWAAFGRLVGLSAVLDLIGALTGSLLAASLIWQFADDLGIPPHMTALCLSFTCAMLLGRMSTPSGIIRVLNRFDIGAVVEATVPIGRLIGALLIWANGPTVERFLVFWAVIELGAMMLYWLSARRLLPQAFNWSLLRNGRAALKDQQGIIGFTAVTYMASTLDGLVRQGPLLLVGTLFGAGAAGMYRMAEQLAQGVDKLALFASRAVFPDLTSIYMQNGPEAAMRLVARLAVAFAAAGAAFSLLAWLVGPYLMLWMGGAAFTPAAGILVPLVLAASIELAAVAFEPLLFAAGRASQALSARIFAAATLTPALLWAAHYGPEVVAWMTAAVMVIQYSALSIRIRKLSMLIRG